MVSLRADDRTGQSGLAAVPRLARRNSRRLHLESSAPTSAACPPVTGGTPSGASSTTTIRLVADSRPGANPGDVWWDGDAGQVGWFVYAFESLWLPASLLENASQDRLVDALFAASRHWEVELHFNKGLAGAPPEAIAAGHDTATNPAVLDAFALAIIASGQGHAYPGIPGHQPDLAAARKEGDSVATSMERIT